MHTSSSRVQKLLSIYHFFSIYFRLPLVSTLGAFMDWHMVDLQMGVLLEWLEKS